jgi:hypothetical protein
MFANWPPLGLFQVQTFGGLYSGELVIHAAPDLKVQAGAIAWGAENLQLVFYSRAFQCGQAPLSPTLQDCVKDCIVATLDLVEPHGVAGWGIVTGLAKGALKSA